MKKGRVTFFVTGNIHKFREARSVLSKYNIAVAMLNMDAIEIQADDIETIAETSASDAAQKSNLPVFVEDAGLFIEVLDGFPGPYSSYVYKTLGAKGILKLMVDVRKRDAYFYSVVAFCDPRNPASLRCFRGKVKGKMTDEERGNRGFGFDPVFEPKEGGGKSFAEMTTEDKNKFSHRAQALRKFAEWYAAHV